MSPQNNDPKNMQNKTIGTLASLLLSEVKIDIRMLISQGSVLKVMGL